MSVSLSPRPHRCLSLITILPVPFSNINRGDDGRPKNSMGPDMIRRLAPSSQFRKYSIRHGIEQGNYIRRSRWLPSVILHDAGLNEASPLWSAWLEALILGMYKMKSGKGKDKALKNGHLGGLVLVSDKEIRTILDTIQPLVSSTPPKNLFDILKKDLAMAQGGDEGSVIRAFFGRMATNCPMVEHRDSALHCGHAFSLQAIQIQDEYGTAVDDEVRTPSGKVANPAVVDLEDDEEEEDDGPSGAGHIFNRYFSTACDLFTEDVLDLDQIAINEGYASLEEACAVPGHREDIIHVIVNWLWAFHHCPLNQAAHKGNHRANGVVSDFTLIRSFDHAPVQVYPAVRYAYYDQGQGKRVLDQAVRDIDTYIQMDPAKDTVRYDRRDGTLPERQQFEADVRALLNNILP